MQISVARTKRVLGFEHNGKTFHPASDTTTKLNASLSQTFESHGPALEIELRKLLGSFNSAYSKLWICRAGGKSSARTVAPRPRILNLV